MPWQNGGALEDQVGQDGRICVGNETCCNSVRASDAGNSPVRIPRQSSDRAARIVLFEHPHHNESPMSDVTHILSQIESGDPSAAEQLFPLVYQELRRLAKNRMASERSDHSLQATGLVHEAYLRLVDLEGVRHWDSRGHFFAVAAETMRRILIDNARRRRRVKHGGDFHRANPDVLDGLVASLPDQELLALDEAMEKLAVQDESAAQLIKLRFYAGLSMPQIAESLGRPLRSIEREWRYARSWLHREISAKETPAT